MNTIDVGRNELARLGLHPGARHPNVVDSTPVQDEDSTIFYDYWTFNRPTVIKTSETGRLLEATVYDPTTTDDEQAITIVGEAACQEYVRQAVAWKSEDADRIRQDAAHAHIMARITELAEDNPTLAQAVEAAKRAQPTTEAGPQENAHVGESTEAAARATQRSSIPPEMLGKSAPRIGTQAFTTRPMQWVPSSAIHEAEGRSL